MTTTVGRIAPLIELVPEDRCSTRELGPDIPLGDPRRATSPDSARTRSDPSRNTSVFGV